MSRNRIPRKTCLLSHEENVALARYNIRPDCSLGLHAHISTAEKADMQLMGEIEIIPHYFAPYGTFARRTKGRKLKPSPATIKKSEMLANAGVMGVSGTVRLNEIEKDLLEQQGEAAEDFVERAQAKVRLWPVIGDTKAVRVGPAHWTGEGAGA